MQAVLCHQLWREIKRVAVNARVRKAAIAYVTKDLIGFKRGDVLVVDASELLRKRLKRSTLIFLPYSDGPHSELSFKKFQGLMVRSGERRAFRQGSQRLLDPDIADAISRGWRKP